MATPIQPPLPKLRNQRLTIIAQDPGVRIGEGRQCRILTAKLEIPAEELASGPWGYRIQVIDYDASTDTLLKPVSYEEQPDGTVVDPYAVVGDEVLLSDPKFHQQNVYAIVMRVLSRFEHALGRRVSWSFGGHQLKIAPHAFADANAFYSKEDEALLFGYFADPKYADSTKALRAGRGVVFACLSHDVIAHEATHALVDGLRSRFTEPSSPDQAAFHEGISDVVALLSVFALPEVMLALLGGGDGSKRVSATQFTPESLRQSALFSLAEQMGTVLNQVRGSALRRSAELAPSKNWINNPEFLEPHRRGEILVAAILNALIHIWAQRVQELKQDSTGRLDLVRAVEEGSAAADYLLTMSIRALDYCPPVHLIFGDYLSALLTVDREIRPNDTKYSFREHLLNSFKSYGIEPTSPGTKADPGVWQSPEAEAKESLVYERNHFDSLRRDRDEVFRFIWENRDALCLCSEAYTEVQSVRPCVRVGDDGFVLDETVAEYVQILRITPAELEKRKLKLPPADLLPRDQEIFLHGGGTLIFDEWGRLKYHIHNRLVGNGGRITKSQVDRLRYLAERGYYLQRTARVNAAKAGRQRFFAQMHIHRGLNRSQRPLEGWLNNAMTSTHTHADVNGSARGDDEDLDDG